MPRRKFVDKKTATTFALVHRAQNDPLLYDEDAPSMVLAEKQTPLQSSNDDYPHSSTSSVISSSASEYGSKKTKQRGDLEEEFGLSLRRNEGEAAQHGVFYDDTDYDYMQHIRDLGSGQGVVTWVEAHGPQAPPIGAKGKQKLEDALRDLDFADSPSVGTIESTSSAARSLLPEEVLPSEFLRRRTYQDQQDVPDEIAGFQPDMDPRLREVLEALEDEEYVDDEEDIFAELTQDGVEVDRDEWERIGVQQSFDEDGGDDAGWESDDTITAGSSPPSQPQLRPLSKGEVAAPPEDTQAQPPADPTEGAWIDEFKKFKSDTTGPKIAPAPAAAPARSTLESSILSSLATGHKKKRKGAKTSTTNYSMTSSALARTDQQTLLDARFDKALEKEDAEVGLADDELNDISSLNSAMTGNSKASAVSRYSTVSGRSCMSGISSYSRTNDSEAPQLERSDFDCIMDEFLGGYSMKGRRVKRGPPQTGMQQLDEIRDGLGPARVKSRSATKVSS